MLKFSAERAQGFGVPACSERVRPGCTTMWLASLPCTEALTESLAFTYPLDVPNSSAEMMYEHGLVSAHAS